MAKSDKFYFQNFASCTLLSKEAAEYLVQCMENYDPDNMVSMLANMHAIEHQADLQKHAMNEALTKAFVTPVDREDLDMLSHRLDDVTDQLEEILQKFYIYKIPQIEPAAVEFAKKLVKACDMLYQIMLEFENFKRSKNIRQLVIELNDVEEECDELYLSCMRKLTENSSDVLLTISWRKIYECLEACADSCEHVGDCIGSVIMKNT